MIRFQPEGQKEHFKRRLSLSPPPPYDDEPTMDVPFMMHLDESDNEVQGLRSLAPTTSTKHFSISYELIATVKKSKSTTKKLVMIPKTAKSERFSHPVFVKRTQSPQSMGASITSMLSGRGFTDINDVGRSMISLNVPNAIPCRKIAETTDQHALVNPEKSNLPTHSEIVINSHSNAEYPIKFVTFILIERTRYQFKETKRSNLTETIWKGRFFEASQAGMHTFKIPGGIRCSPDFDAGVVKVSHALKVEIQLEHGDQTSYRGAVIDDLKVVVADEMTGANIDAQEINNDSAALRPSDIPEWWGMSVWAI